ncbi:MAG TPA: tail fiber domain-containing protein [Pyrinomonadaceae bacterium]|nr:tail fiber domain-containing protein [Pyrinomonadaceae bacterium]
MTASASADRVRFTAPAEAVRLRLQVYTEDGQVLFEGAREGGVFDWPLQDNAGARLPAGSYLAVVTVETLAGAKKQRAGVVAVEGGGVSIRAAEAGRARAAARDTDAAPLTVVAEGGAEAVTAVAHDGEDGQVTSTKGSLTFRTGDFFAGRERERMRITPDGRVGVGTDAPEAALDVAGEIRARGGIRFEDGTVITSAKDFGRPDAKAAAGNTTTAVALAAGTVGTANLSGTGTANYLPKWLDNTGSLGDSVLSEANGNIVVNGGNIQLNTPASTQKSTNLLFLDNNAKTMGMVASATPTLGAANGPLFYMRGNAYSTVAGQRGMFVLGAGNVSSPTGREGSLVFNTLNDQLRMIVKPNGNVGVGTENPTAKLEVAGSLKLSGAGNGITFPDGTTLTSAGGAGGSMTGAQIVSAVNSDAAAGTISDARLSPALARLGGPNNWTGVNVFSTGLSAGGALVTDVGNPVNAGDAVNKAYTDANFVKFVPGAEQLSVGDANGTAPMINLRGGSTCCSGPGGHTPAWFKVFQNGSFVATGNLGIGVSPMQGKGYRTSWDSYKGAFRSGYADNEWDDANVGFFSWAGGSNSTAIGLYALAFGDTNQAESTSSIVFGSGNQVKGAAGFSAGAGNRVCDTYGVAFGNKAQSGGPLIDGKCDPDTFNIRGLAAVAIGYNVTADQDHTTAMGKFASNNGFTGTFIWSDGAAMQSADTFRNTANNEFALRATGGIRFRTNLGGTTGCNLPAGSGVFNCTSSRATKENFFKVDGEDVLSKLRKVEVSTWNYIAEGGQVRHMGPMAEDFYSTFRLGTNNTSIGVQDLAGVSLAAVKALDERTAELQQKTAEVEQLRARLSTLEARLAAIEQALKDKYEEGERE